MSYKIVRPKLPRTSAESKSTAPLEQLVLGSTPKLFNIQQSNAVSNRYDIYLSEAIGQPSEYVELFSLLQSASATDAVYFHINCPGGDVDTGLQLIAHMKDSQAHVVTACYGTTCSMGTAIFLSGDEYMVSRHSRLMIHNYSGVLVGKGHELHASLASTSKQVTDAFYDIHVPFVTEEEYSSIMKGEDLWLHDQEIVERLERLVQYRNIIQIQAQIEQNLDTIDLLVEDNELLQEQLTELLAESKSDEAELPSDQGEDE